MFGVNFPVGPQTRLSYKIFPEFTGKDAQYPSTYVAVDLHFTDGSYLSGLSPVDQHGVQRRQHRRHPGGNANGTPSYGNIVVAKPAYRLLDTSRDSAQPFLFATTPYQIPAGKTLVSVTLPTQTGDPGSAGRIQVFAIAHDGTPDAAPATAAPKDQTATPGKVSAITVNGSGFAPNEAVTIRFGDGLTSTTVHANGDGVISGATISVPGTAKPGSTSIMLAGADSVTRVRLPFRVTGPN